MPDSSAGFNSSDSWHIDIKEHSIELRRAHQRHRFLPPRGLNCIESQARQSHAERSANGGFIINDQNHCLLAIQLALRGSIGRETKKVVPSFSSLITQAWPRCASAAFLTIERPIPVPL